MDDSEDLAPAQADANDNAPLFVSLYVVLLAFFILLVSISSVDKKKMEQVAEGISEAFSIPRELITAEITEDVGAEQEIHRFFDEMQQSVATLVPLQKLKILRAGQTMEIRIPMDELYSSGEKSLRADRQGFIDRIAATLQPWAKDYRIEIDALLARENALRDAANAADTLEVARAGSFVRTLIARGVQPNLVRIGIQADDPGMMVLVFTVRDVIRARLPLAPQP